MDYYEKTLTAFKNSFMNAYAKLDAFNPPDTDVDKIKQIYSINDNTYERLKAEANKMVKLIEIEK